MRKIVLKALSSSEMIAFNAMVHNLVQPNETGLTPHAKLAIAVLTEFYVKLHAKTLFIINKQNVTLTMPQAIALKQTLPFITGMKPYEGAVREKIMAIIDPVTL